MAEREYKRLTRSRARSAAGIFTISRSSLWLGKDHVLVVETSGYAESYKRFYFRDLQSITLWQTRSWMLGGIITGVCAALSGWVAYASGDQVSAWIFGIVGGIFLMSAVYFFGGGPTCRCQFRTAVQTEELPSLNRVRRARNVIERLLPFIVEAQGIAAPQSTPAPVPPSVTSGSPAATAEPKGTTGEQDAPPRIVS